MASRLFLTLAFVFGFASSVRSQEHPARRLSSIVGVAVEEYAKGVDASGRLTSELEYQEAVDFLQDARGVAERLSGDRAATVRLFVAALGNEGALELPTRALDVAAGRALYASNCASCHGAGGAGDGLAAKGMTPPPPAIGDASEMADRTPALLFRVISVGIAGTPMAGWGERLSADQRWDVVAYLHSLRATDAQRLEGEGLYARGCVGCHGALGAADGPAAAALTRLPPDIGTFAWQTERSDAALARIIREGVPGTAMPSSATLDTTEVARVVAYLRGMAASRAPTPNVAAASADAEGIARRVLATLDQSLV